MIRRLRSSCRVVRDAARDPWFVGGMRVRGAAKERITMGRLPGEERGERGMVNYDWLVIFALSILWLMGMAYGLTTLNKMPGPASIRKRLWCDDMGREADVEFEVRHGMPESVRHCSILGDFDIITCHQRCLEQIAQAA